METIWLLEIRRSGNRREKKTERSFWENIGTVKVWAKTCLQRHFTKGNDKTSASYASNKLKVRECTRTKWIGERNREAERKKKKNSG